MNKTGNILTIDLEEWYHALFSQNSPSKDKQIFEDRVKSTIDIVLGVLDKKDCYATFFVLGELVNKYPEMIKRIADDGHEIGVHGYSHKQVCEMSVEEFRHELRECKRLIQKVLSKDPVSFRAPAFSLKLDMIWAFQVLEEEGFKFDSSIFPTLNPLYGDIKAPREPFMKGAIKEFPPTTLNVMGLPLPVAGGFYFRAFPLALIKYGIKNCIKREVPFMLYLHPWEFDPGHPMPIDITFRERITHYHNLVDTLKKLEYLLDRYKFTSIAEFETTDE